MVLGLQMDWEGKGGPEEGKECSGGVDGDVDGLEEDAGVEEHEGVAEGDDGVAEEELND